MATLTLQNTNKEADKIDFEAMDRAVTIDLEIVHERPPIAISIGKNENGYYNPFGTYGNISLIKGEEKARKSFLKSIILASSIGGQTNNYNCDLIKGHNLQDKWILDLDGEQDDYYAWTNGIRIPKMVGTLPDNYQVKKLREYTPYQRNQYLEWIFMESEYRNNLGIVSMDGFVDFVNNFNDQLESNTFTQSLMSFSSKARCHIMGVLHLNPGTTKARGHLGTILQQKCESVVTITDQGNTSLVNCQRARGTKFDDFILGVEYSKEEKCALPYISDDVQAFTIEDNKDPFK